MVADKIKKLREQLNMSQAELAKKIGITRSSVNAWEQGISVPSTQYIVELSEIFNVSTDFLLLSNNAKTVNVSGLTDEDILYINDSIIYLQKKNKKLKK